MGLRPGLMALLNATASRAFDEQYARARLADLRAQLRALVTPAILTALSRVCYLACDGWDYQASRRHRPVRRDGSGDHKPPAGRMRARKQRGQPPHRGSRARSDAAQRRRRRHPPHGEVERALQSYAKTGNIKPQQLRDFRSALGVRFIVTLNLLEFRYGSGDRPPPDHERGFFDAGVTFRDSIEARLIGTLSIIDTAGQRPVATSPPPEALLPELLAAIVENWPQ